MKIVYLLDKPNLYGSEKHVLDILSYFKDRGEVSIIFFGAGPLIPYVQKLGIGYSVIPVKWYFTSSILSLFWRMRQLSPSLVHCHQPKANFWGSIVCRVLKIKIANTFHADAAQNAMLKANPLEKWLTLRFHNLAKAIAELLSNANIFVSEYSLRKAFRPKKGVLIYNWLKDRPSPTHQSPCVKSRIKIITVGSISKAKGYDLLVDFLQGINDLDYEIDIFGDGNTELKSRLKEIKGVTLHGHSSDVWSWYAQADCFVLFSRVETFGLVYIEAAAFGLPVFALNLPVLREILPPGNVLSNNIQEHVDKFRSLKKGSVEFAELSNANRFWVLENFDYSRAMQKLEALYHEILSDSAS